ncbi:MAG: hypothetical protein HOJ55_08260 [Euryarchaeota archaeon]|jgi:hypothetical protein|nr:hypothetical protein [Euryarchaeota archaeon]MBT5593826.1 hypothetical protein [Euryarchaeota archaeon]
MEKWSVVRCPACKNCHGTRTRARQCPHCGQTLASTTPVVATADSAAQLRIEVALANTPKEIRDELRIKLEASQEPLVAINSTSPRRLYALMVDQAGEAGIIRRRDVEDVLNKVDTDLDADDLLDQLEINGTIIRRQDGTWQLLE